MKTKLALFAALCLTAWAVAQTMGNSPAFLSMDVVASGPPDCDCADDPFESDTTANVFETVFNATNTTYVGTFWAATNATDVRLAKVSWRVYTDATTKDYELVSEVWYLDDDSTLLSKVAYGESDAVSTGVNGNWSYPEFTFENGPTLSAGTKYAIVLTLATLTPPQSPVYVGYHGTSGLTRSSTYSSVLWRLDGEKSGDRGDTYDSNGEVWACE